MSTQRLTLPLDASYDIDTAAAPAATQAGPSRWRRLIDALIAMRMEEARRYIERCNISHLLPPDAYAEMKTELKRRTVS